MTEKLRDVLQDEASAARVPPTDLGPVLRAGGRAVRRRRLAGSAGVAAGLALAVVIAPSVGDRIRGDADVAGAPGEWSGAWADAESVHYGDIEVPRPDHLFGLEASQNGALFIDWKKGSTTFVGRAPDPDVEVPKSTVYWLDPEGQVDRIGQGAFGQAAVDGPIAVWFEDPDGKNLSPPHEEEFTLVVYDTARMREIARLPGVAAPSTGFAPAVLGLSGSSVYYEIARGPNGEYWRWDWRGGTSPEQLDVPILMDAAPGVLAVAEGPDRHVGDRFTEEDGDLIAEADGLASGGRLSPDGRYFLTTDDAGWTVARTDGSVRVPLRLDGWHLSQIAGWDASGNVTLLVARADVEDDVSIASCSPVDGTCEIVVESAGQGGDVFLANTMQWATE